MPSAIGLLLFWCSPAAVPGLVVAVHVDSIKSLPLRSLSHVRQEVHEGVPASADADAAAAVVGVMAGTGGVAMTPQAFPTEICRSTRHPMGDSVLISPLGHAHLGTGFNRRDLTNSSCTDVRPVFRRECSTHQGGAEVGFMFRSLNVRSSSHRRSWPKWHPQR